MRWFVILACIFVGSAGAAAEERPILQLDTGGHMAIIKGLAFTPEGNFIVSTGDDKVIRIWDWQTGKTVRAIRGQSGPGQEGKIFAMALSPDGRWLAVGGFLAHGHGVNDEAVGDIRLYDFASGQVQALLKGHRDAVFALAFSADGKKLISGGGDSNAILWDVETQKPLHRLQGHRGQVYAVGFMPDGVRAVTGSYDKTLRLWSVANGALIKEMAGHREKVQSLAISPVDSSIASGDVSGEIRLWDGNSGAFEKVLAKQGGVVGFLRFSPDGSSLLSACGYTGCSDTQRIFNIVSGKELTAYAKHGNTVLASAFSPNGSLVATGGGEKFPIHVWDPKTGETKAVLEGTGQRGWAVGFSADGRSIAWGSTQHASDINNRGPLEMTFHLPGANAPMAEPKPLTSQEGWVRAKASFGDLSLRHRKGGNYGYDAILDVLKDGKPSGVSIERDVTSGLGFYSYTFVPDGQSIISGGGTGEITAYGLDGKKMGEFTGHEAVVWAVAASPDGRYLLSGSSDQTVRLWNLNTRELLITIFRGTDGEWVIWTPEGFYAGSAGADKIVGWQINQGPDMAARYITAGQLRKALHRPDLVAAKIAGDPDGLVKEAAGKLNIDELIRKSLAPTVAILSPQNGASGKEFLERGRTRVRIAVAARITDGGGGIGRISFKLNGQAVASAYGALMLDKDGIITRAFDLATPDTAIEVVAEDADSKVESLPASITVHADPKALAGVPDLYVLAIGANHYRDTRKSLSFAVKDAEALAGTLKAAGVGYYRNAPIVKTLFDDEVTADKVGAAFEELSRQVKAGDVFVFYIAGHGKTLKAGGDYYFLPPSEEGFSDEEIARQGFGPRQLSAWFETIPALKSIWIFDTCESGSAERVFRTRSAALDDAALQRLKDATGRTIFMASAEQQSAVEGYRNHGVFTYALLEGLAKAGSSDKVQLYDLASYVQTRVPELSRELKACEVRNAQEYCQKPLVTLGHTPDYPVLPRYLKVLPMLAEGQLAGSSMVPLKPTHVVLAATDLFESAGRGPQAKRIEGGELVAVVKVEGGFAQIAQNGAVLGYVEQAKLLKLRQ
ncbi:MAG: caspase family protein [Rhodomicrobium sp.]